MQHPDVRSAIRKIEEVTMVPYQNYESFQVGTYSRYAGTVVQ
jgi:hypothetical protein